MTTFNFKQGYFDLLDMLEFPGELPPGRVLRFLPGDFAKDWERGKELQHEHGFSKIPGKTECEVGAGYWDRVIRPMASEMNTPEWKKSRADQC